MSKANGVWCCYCDFCDESPCIKPVLPRAIFTVNFSDNQYMGACRAHFDNLDAYIARYLATHPGVIVDDDDRTEGGRNDEAPPTTQRPAETS